MGTNIYQGIYDIINTYIFGGTIVAGSYQDLVAIVFSVCGCVYLATLPFSIVSSFKQLIGWFK